MKTHASTIYCFYCKALLADHEALKKHMEEVHLKHMREDSNNGTRSDPSD